MRPISTEIWEILKSNHALKEPLATVEGPRESKVFSKDLIAVSKNGWEGDPLGFSKFLKEIINSPNLSPTEKTFATEFISLLVTRELATVVTSDQIIDAYLKSNGVGSINPYIHSAISDALHMSCAYNLDSAGYASLVDIFAASAMFSGITREILESLYEGFNFLFCDFYMIDPRGV